MNLRNIVLLALVVTPFCRAWEIEAPSEETAMIVTRTKASTGNSDYQVRCVWELQDVTAEVRRGYNLPTLQQAYGGDFSIIFETLGTRAATWTVMRCTTPAR